MIFAPPEHWRSVKLDDRHASPDDAQHLKELSHAHSSKAEKIALVQKHSEQVDPERSQSGNTRGISTLVSIKLPKVQLTPSSKGGSMADDALEAQTGR